MPYDRTDRFRRAAILVASLDEALAEQLLGELPPGEAARVLSEAEALESIDHEEQQDVLTEFRRMTRTGRSADAAVEFAYSADEPSPAASPAAAAHAGTYAQADVAVSTLSEGDAAAMAELLGGEHPQIVAAALSRLGEAESAAVFAALPSAVQTEALARLAALAPVDEEAVQEVEFQIQQRLQMRREHHARTAAGAELVQRILARTPTAQRTYLLERMAARDAMAAAGTEASPPGPAVRQNLEAERLAASFDPVAQQALNLASAVRRAQAAGAYDHENSPTAPATIEDRSAELERLRGDTLVAVLRAADEATVLRALAASGERFLARVTSMLPRKQAKKLRQMLRDLGPTRLADLHRAQHELLRLAEEQAGQMAA
ncbi:MAG TPA: FliG C-terminal domain-containing protein [Lacipirellulaceae bacterium]|nr:FliG C-terminal domain-containing protein [Lacipirellulaceae bacterium]